MVSMKERCLLTVILVNEKREIIDGQHRFEVLKELSLPINYIIADGYGLGEVQTLNTNTKNWGNLDYAKGYAILGNEEYKTYLQFREEHGLQHHQTVMLLTNMTAPNKKIHFTFKNGFFKVANLLEAEKNYGKMCQIGRFYDGFKRRIFFTAMGILFKKKEYKHDRFIKKLNQQPTRMVNCVTVVEYIKVIEAIYNYRCSDKNKSRLI
ncbi:hypothetical protein KAR91_12110 [Candidatus Pacearchaeota archaeon]|nr:hypothetical protein [Candidatus Pacearchaeota archaeon]